MRTVELEADSGLLVVAADAPSDPTTVETWLAEGLRQGRLVALRLGRVAVGRSKPFKIAVVDAADLEATMAKLEEGFAFALEASGAPLSVGDPIAPAEARRSLDPLPAGPYWVGVYPVSPDEPLGDFALVFLKRDEALSEGICWPEVPSLDSARRTPEDTPSPIPVPSFDDDLEEVDAAAFMRSLFAGRTGKPEAGPKKDGEPMSPMQKGLQALVDAELLELVDPAALGKLADRLEDEAAEDPFVMRHLGAWLVEQAEVDDVFGEDAELETIVRAHAK